MKNVYAKYLFCTCKYLLQRVLLQMIHEQVCVMIKMIKINKFTDSELQTT